MASKLKTRLPYFALGLLTLILDRWTKLIIDSRLDLHETVPIIDGFFNITYVRNTGVAFGFLSSSADSPTRMILLSLFAAVAVVAVVIYSFKNPADNRPLQLGLGLILGGALGNFHDRLRFGYVIDFLEFHVGSFYWPSFNVADIAITSGVFLLLLEVIRSETPGRT